MAEIILLGLILMVVGVNLLMLTFVGMLVCAARLVSDLFMAQADSLTRKSLCRNIAHRYGLGALLLSSSGRGRPPFSASSGCVSIWRPGAVPPSTN